MKDIQVVREAAADAEEAEVGQWVTATLSGDLRAFDRLVERFQRRAVSIAYRLLGNSHDAMDVCQEAFLRAFRSLDGLEEPKRFGAWLTRIVSNLALNYRRARKTNLSLVADDRGESVVGDVVPVAPDAESAPGHAMISAELDSAISRAVDALPEKQRLALILFAIEGLPQKEVADILETSVEAVKWHVFQARKTLKAELADYLIE
ncbi:MAG: sigma-70 family RNA polymerase sigma factor [Phycisphaerae bacterium]|nr:sigma-70 family RNA polymerase sigma factor [Phycisphaerae bacterium]